MLQTSAPTAKADLEAYYRAIRKRLRSPPAAVLAVKRPCVEPVADIVAATVVRAMVVQRYTHPIGPCRPHLWEIMLTPAHSSAVQRIGSQRFAQKVLAEIVEKHGVTAAEILSEMRDARIVLARHELMYRLHHEALWSYPRIGRFCNRDPTTCMAGERKHRARIERGRA